MRPRPHRVIVGVDGSPHSATALTWAAADARLRGWELVVLTACAQDMPRAGPGVSRATATARERACLEAQARVLQDLPPRAAPPVSTLIRPGDPVAILVSAATADDILVVGTRGQGRLRSLLLGSVAQGCAEQARCPVVIVPSPAAGATPADVHRPVVAGVDSSPEARAALRFAAGEAMLRDAELVPVHAVYPDYATAQASADRDAVRDHLLSPLDSAWVQLDALVRAELADLNIAPRPVAVCGTPEEVLLRWAESATLVAIGARGSSRLHAALPGSVGTRLLSRGHCPVAVIPSSAAAA